jgi:predicted DNA-binding protein (UPF0251 family)
MIDTSPCGKGSTGRCSVVLEGCKECLDPRENFPQGTRLSFRKIYRDELIRRLAAAGVSKKDIAEKIGLTQRSVQRIVPEGRQNVAENPIKSTSAAEELEAQQREIERLKAEKEALAAITL